MNRTSVAYDLIGDIHGHFDALKRLLSTLGYRPEAGTWRHPQGRQVIFLGDLIDRGPGIREVLQLVRSMTEAGQAQVVMGNHEYNALCYQTWVDGVFLRPHSAKNAAQFSQTLKAFAAHPGEWLDWLAWFYTLPLWLDLPGLRVVHATWDSAQIATLTPGLRQTPTGLCLSPETLWRSAQPSEAAHQAVEILLKGWEAHLPNGEHYADKEGHLRTSSRIRWWPAAGARWADWLITDAGQLSCAEAPFDSTCLPGALYPADAPPVFVGHYWMKGTPRLLAPNVCCLDYSVAKGGQLVAYRWDGEQQLEPGKLVGVPAQQQP
ncbi:MAG: metallophosphoesterase [Candidatus Sericytochromatia bacterium]